MKNYKILTKESFYNKNEFLFFYKKINKNTFKVNYQNNYIVFKEYKPKSVIKNDLKTSVTDIKIISTTTQTKFTKFIINEFLFNLNKNKPFLKRIGFIY